MFANRALVRARSDQWTAAVEDAKRSLRIQLSPVGRIAMAIALAGQGDQDGALREFYLSFRDGRSKDNKLLLLLRPILLFTSGKYQDAIFRIRGLLTNSYNDSEDNFLKIFSWSFEGLDIRRHLCEFFHAEGRVKEAAE